MIARYVEVHFWLIEIFLWFETIADRVKMNLMMEETRALSVDGEESVDFSQLIMNLV